MGRVLTSTWNVFLLRHGLHSRIQSRTQGLAHTPSASPSISSFVRFSVTAIEDAVGQLGVPAAEGDAAVVAQAADLREDGSRVLRAADDELLEERAGEGQREPGNGGQPFGGVVGLAGRELGGLAQAARPHAPPGRCCCAGPSRPWLVQMFEVAFSRRMCCSRVWSVSTQQRLPWRSVVWPTIRPGILRTYVLAAGHDAQVGPAERHRVAQRLSLGHDDVGAVVARPAQQAQADRIDAHDRQGSLGVDRLDEGLDVLELAEEVGVLHDDGGGLVGDRGRERRWIDRSAAARGP